VYEIKVKGLQEILDRLPDYSGRGIIRYLVLGIGSFLVGLCGMVGVTLWSRMESAPFILVNLRPIIPVLMVGIVEALGFGLIREVWKIVNNGYPIFRLGRTNTHFIMWQSGSPLSSQ
jgi:hypothetical protein